jgi:tRNA G18 (ribose-2'-O)-methylase SpoU
LRVERGRTQLAGAAAIEAALDRGEPVRLILLRRGARGAAIEACLERADAAGVPVRRVSAREFERLRRAGPARNLLALAGPPPQAGMGEVLAGGGAVWLLSGIAYPGNAGFAIRTAEVSGAAGVFLDATFDHAGRRAALRASIHANRFMPVLWKETEAVLAAARASRRRIVAIEDVGSEPPWAVDLTGRILFVVGGEAAGIPESALARCDAVVRIAMAGFIPSYNLQTAVAAVATERLRQLEGEPR